MDNCGIYKIINKTNGKVYIGSSKQISTRKASHFRMLKNDQHHSYKLQSDYNKHRLPSFEFEVIELCEVENLLVREQHWMDFYQSYNLGYNCSVFSNRPSGTSAEGRLKRVVEGNQKYVDETVRNLNILYRMRKGLPEDIWVSVFDLNLNNCAPSALFKRYAKCTKMLVDVAEQLCLCSPEFEYRFHYINYLGGGSFRLTPVEISEKKSKHSRFKSNDLYPLLMTRLECEMRDHQYGRYVWDEFIKQLW